MADTIIVTLVDAPDVILADNEKAGAALLKFYRALGWDGKDELDPCKVKTTKAVYNRLYDTMYAKCPEPVGIGMLMVNQGPSTDDNIPPGKVCLLEGWVKPYAA
jgi:hypothetical protein